MALMAHQEPPAIAQPSEGALHLPALLVSRSGLRGAPLLGALAFAPLVGRNSQLNTPASQPVPKALAVVSLVGHQLLLASALVVLALDAAPAPSGAQAQPTSPRGGWRSLTGGL